MKIVLTAGLTDYKLSTKLIGLTMNKSVNSIYLIRKTPLKSLPNIININPTYAICKLTLIYELWRFINLLYLCNKKEISMIISIQLILHGIQCRIVGWLTGKPVILSVIGKDVHQYLISWWGKIILQPFGLVKINVLSYRSH